MVIVNGRDVNEAELAEMVAHRLARLQENLEEGGLMGDPYAVSRLHDELRKKDERIKELEYDLDNVSKKYLLLITEFKKHLEQDERDKR